MPSVSGQKLTHVVTHAETGSLVFLPVCSPEMCYMRPTPPPPDYLPSSRKFGIVRLCRGRFVIVLALVLAAGPLAAVAGAAPEQQQTVGLPGPVVGLELSATADSLTVSWQAPEVGGVPKGYIVHIKPEAGRKGSGKTKRPKAKKTAVTFGNLDEGTTYAVWVRGTERSRQGRTHPLQRRPARSRTGSRTRTRDGTLA